MPAKFYVARAGVIGTVFRKKQVQQDFHAAILCYKNYPYKKRRKDLLILCDIFFIKNGMC